MTTTTYAVDGMSCDHCADAVRTELGRLIGVDDVQVDLATGSVTVISAEPPAADQVHAAITEAGYRIAG